MDDEVGVEMFCRHFVDAAAAVRRVAEHKDAHGLAEALAQPAHNRRCVWQQRIWKLQRHLQIHVLSQRMSFSL